MSMYLLPKTSIRKIDIKRRKFLWQSGGDKKKYHLVKWEKKLCGQKRGGLGIKNLRILNISLMCKWWWYLEK
jgi:hypothetical protein